MLVDIEIHPHALKHGLTESNIRYAWKNYVKRMYRQAPNQEQIFAIGCDLAGRMIQMVAVDTLDSVIIYHAMTPPTEKMIRELGLSRR
jgi:hypothetical protein